MTLMIDVFERSRPGTKRAADATPGQELALRLGVALPELR